MRNRETMLSSWWNTGILHSNSQQKQCYSFPNLKMTAFTWRQPWLHWSTLLTPRQIPDKKKLLKRHCFLKQKNQWTLPRLLINTEEGWIYFQSLNQLHWIFASNHFFLSWRLLLPSVVSLKLSEHYEHLGLWPFPLCQSSSVSKRYRHSTLWANS